MDKLKDFYNNLKEPRDFTSLDALSIYVGLAVLFFIQSFN